MESRTVLLSESQHKIVLLNTKVNLVWKQINGVFVGPFVTPEDFETYVKGK